MATILQPSMFSWKDIEADSDLNRLRLVLSVLPDEDFVSLLEQRRGRGRDDYPIRPVWNAMRSCRSRFVYAICSAWMAMSVA